MSRPWNVPAPAARRLCAAMALLLGWAVVACDLEPTPIRPQPEGTTPGPGGPATAVGIRASTPGTAPPSRSPTPTPRPSASQPPAPALASASPTGSSSPAPSALPASPGAAPAAGVPEPKPSSRLQRHEADLFVLDFPSGWFVETRDAVQLRLLLRERATAASLTVLFEPGNINLEGWRGAAQKAFGSTKLTEGPYTLDELRGLQVTGSRDLPEGRRYVAAYGFVYADGLVTVQAIWDKRRTDADGTAAAVAVMLKSLRWL